MNELFKWIIKLRLTQIEEVRNRPLELQSKWFDFLISNLSTTHLFKEYKIEPNITISDFQERVPLHDYNVLKPYIDREMSGEISVLWPGKTYWFAKSSGTTASRSKYIPITEISLYENHYKAGKDILSNYYERNPNADLFSGKTLVVGGSSQTNELSEGSYIGDLSAIIIKNFPWWVEMKRTPSRETALLNDWSEKVKRMALETIDDDVRVISGVPSWTLMLCHQVMKLRKTNNLLDVWPNLELFMHGGVNFEPYKEEFLNIIPKEDMHYLETYNASEGMFGFQDRLSEGGLLLLLDHGIFYEFIPMDCFNGVNSKKVLSLAEVKVGVNYAVVISTVGGLLRYIVGDTLQFISTKPYRFRVTGRTKSFINAFGEELIVENAEMAISQAAKATGAKVMNYTAAPVYLEFGEKLKKGRHEWVIEFLQEPTDKEIFTQELDRNLRNINSDYDAKRINDVAFLAPLIHIAPKGTFDHWLSTKGKLGGQHKVPRLSNDRVILESVLNLINQ